MSVTVTTHLGDLEIVFPSGNSASVSTPGGQSISLGVGQYSFSGRFRLVGGQWEHVEEKMSEPLRQWDIGQHKKPVPPTFIRQAVDAARQAVQTAVSQDPGVLTEAARWHAQNDVDRARTHADKLRAELAQAERELAAAEAVLAAVQ